MDTKNTTARCISSDNTFKYKSNTFKSYNYTIYNAKITTFNA